MLIAGRANFLLTRFKHGFKSFVPVLVLLVYTVVGALIFMLIEGPNEKYELEQLRQQRLKLLEDTTFRLNTIKSMTPLQAYNHTVSTLNHYRERLGVPEVFMNQTQWTIWGSIYFSMTVYTTIGYGNIVPVTTSGRILTIIYALIGIPLALIALITLGGLFAKICLVLWQLIARSLGCFSKKLERKMTIEAKVDENGVEMGSSRESIPSESDEGNDELLQFPVWFLIAVTIIWILLCAYLFLLWEETWDYGFNFLNFPLELGEEEVEPIDGQPQKEAANGKASRAVDFDRTKGLSPEERKQENRRTLDSVVARMPFRSRILYHIMPSDSRKQLTRHVQRRQRVGNKCVQTDQWLLDTSIASLISLVTLVFAMLHLFTHPSVPISQGTTLLIVNLCLSLLLGNVGALLSTLYHLHVPLFRPTSSYCFWLSFSLNDCLMIRSLLNVSLFSIYTAGSCLAVERVVGSLLLLHNKRTKRAIAVFLAILQAFVLAIFSILTYHNHFDPMIRRELSRRNPIVHAQVMATEQSLPAASFVVAFFLLNTLLDRSFLWAIVKTFGGENNENDGNGGNGGGPEEMLRTALWSEYQTLALPLASILFVGVLALQQKAIHNNQCALAEKELYEQMGNGNCVIVKKKAAGDEEKEAREVHEHGTTTESEQSTAGRRTEPRALRRTQRIAGEGGGGQHGLYCPNVEFPES
uniref:Ion_trans_2 domain-containing protein n=1 Tax=Globodera pallida TaxID=36090 RepID=A0A183BLS9_GLOPA